MLSGHIEKPSKPLHLDSLIAFARFQQAQEAGESGDIRDIIEDLPLLKSAQDKLWVWQASALRFEGVQSAGMRHWTRKTVMHEDYALSFQQGFVEHDKNPTGLAKDAQLKNHKKLSDKNGNVKLFSQQIDTASGKMKSELQAYPVSVITKAVAYCIGDAEVIESLIHPEMGYLTNIGKRTRLGHGKIVGFSITDDVNARDRWKERILPWQEDGYFGLEATVIPPYWDEKMRINAWVHPDVL
jgi:CRISPR type IV-associated protein Csf3